MPIEFEVEDGTGKSNSTSYITLEELTQIWVNNGYPTAGVFTNDDEKKALLNRACMQIDSEYSFPGQRRLSGQALAFPRVNAKYSDGEYISYDSVPSEIKKAQAILVYYIKVKGIDLNPVLDDAGRVKRIKNVVEGAVSEEKEYWQSSSMLSPKISEIEKILSRLLLGTSYKTRNLKLVRSS